MGLPSGSPNSKLNREPLVGQCVCVCNTLPVVWRKQRRKISEPALEERGAGVVVTLPENLERVER